ncbi:UL50 [Gallid alphaherpesvirus 2]|uniref:UL50 n=1 Tax=Gallid alphaherpesvirus 2 TaxID=10390 RepID=Q9IBS8_9ALPH|nr:UL50 [Gallid alphaherpesvirus 2]
MNVHESHPRRDRDLENITLEALTVPWRLQFRVDEALYAVNPNGWTCYIEERDQRCLRVTNNCVISLLKSDLKRKYQTCTLNIGIRVAVPQNYVVILAKSTDPDPTSRGIPIIQVANGLIDSGYRGSIRAVLFFEKSCIIPKNGLAIRLSLVKLASPNLNTRVLFNLSDITPHLECGPDFSTSIETAVRLGSGETKPLLPPGGGGIWAGTGCRALACLYNDRVCKASHYTSSDKNIAFVVRYNDSTSVLGLKDFPTAEDETFVRFYTSGQFATLIPFFETFTPKRTEDAAYDIAAPGDIRLGALSSTTIMIQQRYVCMDDSVIPCIFGRSSMNLRSLIIIPSRWLPNSWLTITICNLTEMTVMIRCGDRIAQLLLVDHESATLIPPTNDTTGMFPTVGKCRRPGASVGEPKWRETLEFDTEAYSSERQFSGFGSTGI